jgi:DNA-binding transcriptional regulator YiaG
MVSSLQTNSQTNIWELNIDSPPSLLNQEIRGSHNIEHFITSAVPETQDIVLFVQKAAWEILRRFNADTARLFLVLASQAFQQEKPWEGGFRLFGTSLIKELNWQKRKDILGAEKLDRIAHSAWLLSNLAVKLIWSETEPNCGIDYTRMWHIPLIRQYGESNSQGEIEAPHNLVFAVKPGAWAKHFHNKRAAAHFNWFAQEILKIDTQTNNLALQLAIFVFMDSHMNFKGEYRLRHLVKEVLPQIYIDKLQTERRKSQEFRRLLNHAFDTLTKLGWHIEGYGEEPGFEHFMASWLSIRPPADTTPEKTSEPDPSSDPDRVTEIRPSNAAPISGDEVKEFRKSQNWSQEEFAEILGVSQELVSKIERDAGSVNRSLEQMIRDWQNVYTSELLS